MATIVRMNVPISSAKMTFAVSVPYHVVSRGLSCFTARTVVVFVVVVFAGAAFLRAAADLFDRAVDVAFLVVAIYCTSLLLEYVASIAYSRIMGLHLKQNENRSQLQQRLDVELRAKAAERLNQEHGQPDGVDDSRYIENTTQSTGSKWFWAVVIGIVVAVAVAAYFNTAA